MNHDKIVKAVIQVLNTNKGKRKFIQTVDISINFKGIDFKKPENRINLDVVLPEPRGREINVIAFAENPQIQHEAKKAGILCYGPGDLDALGNDKKKLKAMIKNTEFIAEPKMMAPVARHLGKVLGTANKLPKPIMGRFEHAVESAKKRIRIATRGKYFPVVHCAVGSEAMEPEQIARNIEAVIEKIKSKINEQNISSIYVKLTMGKPVKV